MTVLLTRTPAGGRIRERGFGQPADERGRRDDPTGRADERSRRDDPTGPRRDGITGPTLDDVISRSWEVLRADVPAACPACGGELLPRESAGGGVVGGRCESCGTTLS